MDELLFNSGELRLALEAQAKKMHEAVEAEGEDSLKQADADAWAAALAHHFAVPSPVLRSEDVWREPVKEVNVDVSWDRGRYFSDRRSDLARNFPGYRVVVHIPFEGDAEVFSLQPSSFTLNPPRGRVTDRELVLTIEYARDIQPNIDGQVSSFIGGVSQWLGFARRDLPYPIDCWDQLRIGALWPVPLGTEQPHLALRPRGHQPRIGAARGQ